ncbi:hypothetical protein CARUB_v10027553mg [Capsella rubella]|uniref:DUF7950 domain-containing protein n=1 Tax=Capsella rubella TaxID=81985 RepID=R0GT39_9BRAS|nr:uncharacterized protein LOC17875145 [Capsella rubella]EOA14368.1 hypothetical protein CARUB_v10027553mg [Capsella rubella]
MNFRGGCCIARYGGSGGGGGGYDMSKVDRIMLRYRPIAPRPDSGGSPSSPTEKNGSVLTSVSSKSRRGKRKYSKENNNSSSSGSGSVNSNGNSKRRRKEETKNGSGGVGGGEIVTLPLLPETPEKKKESSPSRGKAAPELGAAALWLSFNDGDNSIRRYQTELMTETVVSSLLTVEGVTERWVEEGEFELGCTDEERKMKLERDTCPCFISDGLGRVVWTNGSYKDLVVGKDQEKQYYSKMSVWLVMKERPLVTYRTFTCRMRLQYTCRDKEVSSITSFCDVWRMSDGGFAWRLDVDAALCLGR